MALEVDPILQKGIGLLLSKSPDSSDKLRRLMFDILGKEYVAPKPEAKNYSEVDTDVEDTGENIGVTGAETMDMDDFAFDMGISCLVCRQFDVSPTNQLIECKGCKELYHQKCHDPPVANDDSSDWTCSKCVKSKTKSDKSSSSSKEKLKKDKTTHSVKSSGDDKEKTTNKSKPTKDKMLKSEKKDKERSKEKNKEKLEAVEKSSKSTDRDKEKKELSKSKTEKSSKDRRSEESKRTDKHKLQDEHKSLKSDSDKEKKVKKAKKEKS